MSTAALSSAFASANRGPLTSIFTPPSTCLDSTTSVSFPTTMVASPDVLITTTKIFVNHFSWGDESCYPGMNTAVDETESEIAVWGNGYYYSPGICPTGWTSACSVSTHVWGFETNIFNATTAVMCCPSSYSCIGGTTTLTAHGCSTFLSSGQTLTSVWAAPQPTPDVMLSIPATKSMTTWIAPRDTSAVCDAVPVMWQNSDVQIISLLAVQATQTADAILTGTRSSQATNTNPSSSTSTIASSGLSTGAKAAIGVVIPVLFLLLVTATFLFFRRRALYNQNKYLDGELATPSDKKILHPLKIWGKNNGPELDSRQIPAEMMDPAREVYELYDTQVPRELETGEEVRRKLASGAEMEREAEDRVRRVEGWIGALRGSEENETVDEIKGERVKINSDLGKSPTSDVVSPLSPDSAADFANGMGIALDGILERKGKGKEVVGLVEGIKPGSPAPKGD